MGRVLRLTSLNLLSMAFVVRACLRSSSVIDGWETRLRTR